MTAAAIEGFLRDLQGVVASIHLYPPGHPRLGDLVGNVVAQASSLTQSDEAFSVFVADNRLIWNDAPLPNSETVARSVFATLRAHGYHRLTVRRGLRESEVVAFARALAAAAGPSRGNTPQSSVHLHLSALDRAEAPRPTGLEFVRATVDGQALARVWDGVLERRELDFDALDVMVMAIARTLEDHSSAMLPLAELKAHDEYTVTHIANVALLAAALGESLALPTSTLREVSIGALLHDIGKLRVPAEVLNHAGRFDDAQRALIERHPEDGARILMATRGVPDLALTVAFEHHMHHDGVGGYPRLPQPWTVNMASEMTHIADVYDALRTNRPYRRGMSRDRIGAIMRHDAGTVFDPDLIDVFFTEVVPRTARADDDC